MGYQGRDVEVVFLAADQCMVAACDSCGAIGDKEFDVVPVPQYIVGRFTTRVALLEVLSVGAIPAVVTVAISNEPSPTGEEILAGVRDELKEIGKPDLPVVISTEKNIPTKQTGVGVTVVGAVERKGLRIGTTQPGDRMYCLGLPKVGPEVQRADDEEIAQASHILKLFQVEGIHDVLPVGSRGIRAEAKTLAEGLGCCFSEWPPSGLDLEKSAGPSTCVLFTACPEVQLDEFTGTPLQVIGEVIQSANHSGVSDESVTALTRKNQ
ncbi:alpha-ribazole kinase [Heliobacillus mobilis]|uniref:Alpha-ribazole kinase n=1 Tax=Heliobacterium mobile TaxID=28064 RepID=A0A6I3SPN5_HELMO|nr:alpha-ribazole kinase [Heliobacterium mobile]MTV51004.1 alpha-ribazole kinase [Heliobacterium mobile]